MANIITMNIIRDALTHTTDGPVTDFVILARAFEFVAKNPGACKDVTDFVGEILAIDDGTGDPDFPPGFDEDAYEHRGER